MTQITEAAFERARMFMKTRARALDRCRFEFTFEGGPGDAVANAVAAYRNDDGGFGRALEPDCRYGGSWPAATTVALACLHEVDVAADAPLVRGALDYLVAAYDSENRMWPFSLPEMNAVPHAPWWHNNGDPDLHDGFALVNPLFAVAGCLHAYRGSVEPVLLADVTALAMRRLDEQPINMEKHIVRDAAFMQEYLPKAEGESALAKLRRAAAAIAEYDAAKWTGYCAAPLWFAPTPNSPLADVVRDGVDAHLEFEIARQDADGSWKPPWTWQGQYDDVWPVAKEEWAGLLTLDMLKCLRAHGRIEGTPAEEAS